VSYPNARDCEHGQLWRKCPHCEVNEVFAAAQAEAARLRGALEHLLAEVDSMRQGFWTNASTVYAVANHVRAALSSPAPSREQVTAWLVEGDEPPEPLAWSEEPPAIEAIGAIEQAAPSLTHDVHWNGVFRGTDSDPRETGWCATCGREVYDGDDGTTHERDHAPELRTDCAERNPPEQSAPDPDPEHQCGGPKEACCEPGCRECGTPRAAPLSATKCAQCSVELDRRSNYYCDACEASPPAPDPMRLAEMVGEAVRDALRPEYPGAFRALQRRLDLAPIVARWRSGE
jgi:hypothetical protein